MDRSGWAIAMYRVIRPNGKPEQSKFVQYSLAWAYLLFSAAGLMLLLSHQVTDTYDWHALPMTGSILLGGVLCCVGCLSGRWYGEFIGGPPLALGLAAFGVEVWLHSHQTMEGILSLGILLLFFGISTVAIARWRVVLATYRFVHAEARTRNGREE